MLSPTPSPTLDPPSFQNTSTKRYSLRNFRLCPQLQDQLQDIGVRHIAGDLLKSLVAIKRNEFVEARNRVEVPHGLFSLRLEKFYERCEENTVYLDVLELVCRETLELAKFCIVLEDLQDYVSRLFAGYHSRKMGPILQDISNTKQLQRISDTILAEFKANDAQSKKLRDRLNAFNVREKNALNYMNGQIYAVQNNCVEAELVLDPIEFRYKLSFHNRTTEQSEQQLRQAEDELQKTLTDLQINSHRETIVSDTIRLKQRMDIEMLKKKLDAMTKKYDQAYDSLDSQISYKLNNMETMQLQLRDCTAKLDFFAVEVVALTEWQVWWAEKKRAEAKAIMLDKKKAKKAKPEKVVQVKKDEDDDDD